MGAGISLMLAIAVAIVMRQVDEQTNWRLFNYSPDGARAVLGVLVGSMLTFIVFVLSATLIVVQLASAQYTPRVIAIIFAQPAIKLTLSLLTFTFTYSLAALARVETRVPDLLVSTAVVLNVICILSFFFFAQHLSSGLRPNVLMRHVNRLGRKVIDQIYPQPFNADKPEASGSAMANIEFTHSFDYAGPSGVVMAFSVANLVQLATANNCLIRLVPQVGDYLCPGDPLVQVAGEPSRIRGEDLRGCIAVGNERTLEQDPRFAFRILVDMASKALSPAINDPTTAVIALDKIHDLLQYLGRRHLGDGLMVGERGALRLVFGTPDWPDFVMLAVSEIRQYGATSLQVHRRLQALLKHLIEVLPPLRAAPLEKELKLLQTAAVRAFPDEDDRQRVNVSDYQGVGESER
jgi:uncharacterized membrane protein